MLSLYNKDGQSLEYYYLFGSTGKRIRPNDKEINLEHTHRQLLNKQQQHGPAESRFFLTSLNYFFVHTLERGTKQRRDTNQPAEIWSKLQKDPTKTS